MVGFAWWLDCWPMDQKVMDFIPLQGHIPWWQVQPQFPKQQEAVNGYVFLMFFFLSLSLFPLSVKIINTKNILGWWLNESIKKSSIYNILLL